MDINQKMYDLGNKRSVIRELFEYGKKRSKEKELLELFQKKCNTLPFQFHI